MEKLRQHFTGVAAKYLSRVDATRNSNQHEIGSNAFALILGNPGMQTIPIDSSLFYFADDLEEPLKATATLSWYDARRNNPNRSPEYRLYYPDNVVTASMTEGDFCIVAVKPDGSVLIIVTPPRSTIERQLRWLFEIGYINDTRFTTQSIDTDEGISMVGAIVLEELGIEVRLDDENWLDKIIERFGTTFPSTAIFSGFARDTSPGAFDVSRDPDAALMEWMSHEEMLFRTLERHIVQQQIDAGFTDVEHFISASLSVQNRRKSRVGHALEHHLAAVFTAHQLPFGRQVVTEHKTTADFLFPGAEHYQNLRYPPDALVMLAAKSTCKDRWRQVLAEARRITQKHLFTLEPAISENQTDEMQAHHLQLVIPAQFRHTYTPQQQSWLNDLSSYISFVRFKLSREDLKIYLQG